MDYKNSDISKYLLALDYVEDSKIGDIIMYADPSGINYITIGNECELMNNILFTQILEKIGKTKKDLELFLNNK